MKHYFANPTKRSMGESLKFKIMASRKNGAEFPVEISLSPIRAEGNLNVLAIVRNVTERVRLTENIIKSEKQYRLLFESAPVPLFECDASELRNRCLNHLKHSDKSQLLTELDGQSQLLIDSLPMVKILKINAAMGNLFGVKSSKQLGKGASKVFSDPSLFGFKNFIANLASGRSSFQAEAVSQKMTGTSFPSTVKTTIPEEYKKSLSRVLISVTDNTQINEAKRILAETEERRFISLADAAAEAIITSDDRGLITYWNAGAQRIFGYSEKEVLGHRIAMLMPENLRAAHAEGIKRVIKTRKSKRVGQTLELVALRKDGEEFPIELSLAKWETREKIYFGAVIRDITERKHAQKTIQHLADYDSLTKLPNRRLFAHLLKKAEAQMKRADKLLALLYLDLDGFKQVNDTFGHDIGDHLLSATAARISERLRESDTAARVGGDEFNIALVDIDSPQNAADVSESILKKLAEPFTLKKKKHVRVVASIGIAIYPTDSRDVETLAIKADAAMRHAKLNGGNTFKFFDKNIDLAA